MPLTATLYVVPLPVTVPISVPRGRAADSVTSPVAKPVTDSLKTTVKLIGAAVWDRPGRPPG